MRSGRAVTRNQMILPRKRVSDIAWAIWPKTRLDTPESPDELRSPSAASASSIMTATGFMARRRVRIFSRLPSVTPCHWLRKFFSLTIGMPISPANVVTMNVLPVPTGPETR